MPEFVKQFVKYQLELRGIDCTDEEIADMNDWFEHWFEDSHDMISDAIYGALRDCGIPSPIEEMDIYTPSATAGDYSPSCPWLAPGMSVHDFI